MVTLPVVKTGATHAPLDQSSGPPRVMVRIKCESELILIIGATWIFGITAMLNRDNRPDQVPT